MFHHLRDKALNTEMNPGEKSKWLVRLQSWAVTLLAVFIATHMVPGITYESPQALLVAGLLLAVAYEFVRPALMLLALPLLILTLTLFRFIINAMLLGLVAALVPGFAVAGFWAAFFGALVISIILTMFGPSSAKQQAAKWQANLHRQAEREVKQQPDPSTPGVKRGKPDTGDGPIIDV